MAHFYGILSSFDSRKDRTKTAGKAGLIAKAQGWHVGGSVEVTEIDKTDTVSIRVTLGSNGGGSALVFHGTREDVLRLIEQREKTTQQP